MTLEQLRIFIAVAEREHMTQAAEALNLTQSAASAAIAALESRHCVKLFDRVGRRILLTAAGKAFLGEARAVLSRAVAAEQALADLAGLKTGTLLIGASQTIGNYWLPPQLARFAQLYPGVSLKLIIGNTLQVAALAVEGGVDLGFVEGDVVEPSLTIEPIADDELVVVMAPNAFAPPQRPGKLWLTHTPWVAREKGSGTRTVTEAALQAFGVETSERNIVLELPSNEAVRAAVEAGAGVAAISRLVVSASIKAGSLKALPLALPRRQFFLLRHKERYQSLAARTFAGMAENHELRDVGKALPG
ncbi:MAG: LysR substrate-binding domain-containing protein [Beijerinckiaceae bacterium]|nr:LysR substrate-binding domain-containing protein [Beijerinckiaceae bacterium]